MTCNVMRTTTTLHECQASAQKHKSRFVVLADTKSIGLEQDRRIVATYLPEYKLYSRVKDQTTEKR